MLKFLSITCAALLAACNNPTAPDFAAATAAPMDESKADTAVYRDGLLCDSHSPTTCGLDSAVWVGTLKEGYFNRAAK